MCDGFVKIISCTKTRGGERRTIETIIELNSVVNRIAWEYVLLTCVFVGGLLLTARSGFVQIRHFGHAMRCTAGKLFQKTKAGKGAVTPLQAVTTALAATVGTGNIIGTTQAIAMGGYGAVFWLWLAALLGMAIKYSEVTLSIRYRERDAKGDWVGGPMYYIKNGMGRNWGWLAALFCVFAALASFGIGNMSQANSVADALANVVTTFAPRAERLVPAINRMTGVTLALVTALVLFGGVKRIGIVAEKLVPFMSVLYIALTLVVIFGNVSNIGHAFGLIFESAFTPEAVLGGAGGITLKHCVAWGLRRSAFSNEAGLGSAAIAHAAAQTPGPVQQGFYGIFEVFVDTIVLCTLTALTIIVSGVDVAFGVTPGSEVITSAFATVLGDKAAVLFVAVALMLFAYSTLLGWSLYGTRCVQYLFGIGASRVYQALFVLAVVVGATQPVDFVWDIADTFNGLMAIPNFIALFALSGVVAKLTREYFSKDRRR